MVYLIDKIDHFYGFSKFTAKIMTINSQEPAHRIMSSRLRDIIKNEEDFRLHDRNEPVYNLFAKKLSKFVINLLGSYTILSCSLLK